MSYPGFCNIMAVMKYTDHMNMLLQLQLKGSAPKEGFRVHLNASGEMQGEFSGSSQLMLDECSLSLVGTSTIASPMLDRSGKKGIPSAVPGAKKHPHVRHHSERTHTFSNDRSRNVSSLLQCCFRLAVLAIDSHLYFLMLWG